VPSPFIFIPTNRLKPGQLDRERERVSPLVALFERDEPRLIAFNEYVNEAGDEVTVVQIHPDAAPMEADMQIVGERSRARVSSGAITMMSVSPSCSKAWRIHGSR
jgi:hypothetical protein